MPSVIEAAMNKAEASNSFSPLVLVKRALERIHISKGMLKMRISVMELGRFTAWRSPEASRTWLDYAPPQEGTQSQETACLQTMCCVCQERLGCAQAGTAEAAVPTWFVFRPQA